MNSFQFDEITKHIDEWTKLDYITPEDIPSIELYMDQITTFMDNKLSGTKRHEDDKILTKTMINNYSKNDLLPPSDKKKYSKDHIILLIYIYYMKNFLSISDINNLLSPMTENHFHTDSGISMSDIYKDLFELEQHHKQSIKENIEDICKIADSEFPEDSDYLKTFALVAMLSYDIYAKKQLIERLIDFSTPKEPSKADIKEAKELAKKKEKLAKEQAKHNK